MNYSSFCEYLLAALVNQMEHGVTISKETIRKNNNVSLDAFIIHMPDVTSAPVVYLQPLYKAYRDGSPIDKIAQTVLARLKKELPLSLELAEQARSLESARDRIAYRLISKKDNKELLNDIPWVPFLDLAVIFYLHLGVKDDKQITTVIHDHQANSWNLSPEELYELAKENTPRLCPSTIGRLEHMLFGWDEEEQRFCAIHHPFTRPVPEDVEKVLKGEISTDICAEAYDVIFNGNELGGGSIRIHEKDLQDATFRALGLDDATIQEQFGHLLAAFSFGAPPHGGLALGLDRVVMLIGKCDSIREVIAFPKNNRGADLMSESPAPAEPNQLRDVHIQVKLPEKLRQKLEAEKAAAGQQA